MVFPLCIKIDIHKQSISTNISILHVHVHICTSSSNTSPVFIMTRFLCETHSIQTASKEKKTLRGKPRCGCSRNEQLGHSCSDFPEPWPLSETQRYLFYNLQWLGDSCRTADKKLCQGLENSLFSPWPGLNAVIFGAPLSFSLFALAGTLFPNLMVYRRLILAHFWVMECKWRKIFYGIWSLGTSLLAHFCKYREYIYLVISLYFLSFDYPSFL